MEYVRACISAALLLYFVCPTLMAQEWEQLPGPTGGEITALLETPGGALLAWQGGGGIYRSEDTGRSWKRVLNHSYHSRPDPLQVDPQGSIYCLSGDGLVRSDDDGRSWTSLTSPGSSAAYTITPAGTMLAAVHRGILRSTDGGLSWDSTQYTPVRYGSMPAGIAVTLDGSCYAAFERDSLVRSTDDGVTWTLVEFPEKVGQFRYLTAPGGGSDLIVVADSGCWISWYEGRNWLPAVLPPGESIRYAQRVGQGRLFARSDRSILFSTVGTLWSREPIPETAAVTAALALDDRRWLIADRFSLWYTGDEGTTWQERSKGMYITDWRLTLDDRPDARLVSMPWISYDYGELWEPARWDSGRILQGTILQRPDGSMLLNGVDEYRREGLWRSPGHGARWTRVGSPPFSWHSMTMTGTADGVIAVESYGDVWASSDEGVTWERRGVLPRDSTGLRLLDLLALSAPDDQVVLAAVGIKGIMRSTDRGSTWSSVPMEGTGAVWVKRILELPDGALIAASWFDIFRSTDRGESWQLVQTASLPANIGIVLTDHIGTVYEYRPGAGIGNGLWIFRSRDAGAHWLPVDLPSPPVPEEDITGISFDDRFRLYLATRRHGIFRIADPLLDIRMPAAVAGDLAIDALYPQPLSAGDALKISCRAPAGIALQVSVYDLAGRLRSETAFPAASGEARILRLPAGELGAGTYILRLTSPTGTIARPFSVLR